VITLVALVLSVIAVRAGTSLEGVRLSRAGHDLVAALRYTRGQAIVTGEMQRLHLDVEARTYRAANRPVQQLPRGLKLSLLTAASEQTDASTGAIRFYPDGSSTGGRVKLTAGEREWRVEVAWLTGEVRLVPGDGR